MSTRYNTGNPIESADVRDMSDNAKNFDEFSNSSSDTFTDRLGVHRKTIDGAIRSVGIPIIGNFTTGCTVTDSNQGVQEVGGSVYRWKGSLPKLVPPSSTPSGTGGVSPAGDWVDVGDASLRYDLSQSSGASIVLTSTGKNVDDAIYDSGVFRGNDLVNYVVSGCAVRRDTLISPDWQLVSDTAHIPINTSGVTGGVDVNIKYSGSKIGSLVAGPDERFAADGVLVGASVSANNANISLGAPCSFYINFDNENSITFDGKFFDASRFSISVSATGLITITHPQRRLMQLPICQHTSGGSSFESLVPHYVSTSSPGLTSLYLIGEAEGLISFNGTSWVCSSSWDNASITASYNGSNGELSVSHPQLIGSPSCKVNSWWNGIAINSYLKSASATGFVVVLRLASDNSIPAQSSALGVYFGRGVSAIRKVPSGRLHSFLGSVQVNCNHVDYENGNFWFMAAMQE